MKIPQLFCAVALVLSITACQNRTSQAELKQSAGETADRIKTETVKAGEKLGDTWLVTKIQAQFVGDREIKARNINVSARDGVVTLKGHVLNESERQLALTLARNTDGVKQVVDQLDVQVAGPPPVGPPTGGTPGAAPTTGTTAPASSAPAPIAASDDARITTSIQSTYFIDDRIKGRHITVTSNAGVVTLQGEIADETERAEALLLARTTEGVKRVEDNLTVSPVSAPAAAAPPSPPAPAPPAATASPAPPSSNTPAPAASSAAGNAAAKSSVASGDADEALASRIKSQLASDNQMKNVSSDSLDVTAKNGVVVLQGTLPTSAAKRRALTVARGIDGVTQVVDRIDVSPAKSSRTNAAPKRKVTK
jgi:osmotically-inducible protein OsmY